MICYLSNVPVTVRFFKDKNMLKEKWVEGLDQWFSEGIDTPGICLIKVRASRVRFWHKEEEGEYIA